MQFEGKLSQFHKLVSHVYLLKISRLVQTSPGLLLGLDQPGGELLEPGQVLRPELHVVAVVVALRHGVLLEARHKVGDPLQLVLVTLSISRDLVL